jgi:hypothetical protein
MVKTLVSAVATGFSGAFASDLVSALAIMLLAWTILFFADAALQLRMSKCTSCNCPHVQSWGLDSSWVFHTDIEYAKLVCVSNLADL